MKHRWAALVFAVSLAAGFAGEPARPNIVVILADDQGWGDLGFTGNTSVATPQIDSLARTGARLDHFYVSPVCSPTRAEFLTGRYHLRNGIHDTGNGGERLDLGEHTIAETFREAGYATGLFGKWHNGGQYPYHPNARGFAEFYGFTQGHWPQYFDAEIEHNGRRVRSQGFLTDDLAEHAADFITAHRDRPFFCYLALNTPHTPLQVPERFFKKFAAREIDQRAQPPAQEDLDFTRAVLAMTENIDWNVGRVLQRLDELGLSDNTIVLYFSDNGPNSWRWNAGMKGRKGSTDEGGVRSPFVIRWPGHIPAGTVVPDIAAAIDLLPTLADLAGLAPGGAKPLDGISLKPLLLVGAGPAPAWPQRMIFSEWEGRASVRTPQYRLDAAGALYDLTRDPGQAKDLAAELPAVVRRLRQAVAAWKQEVSPRDASDHRPFPVGYRIMPHTELPAGDGVPHGAVKRSARWPNSSYFTHWTTTDDRLTWEVEVATAGRYRATVYYACPAADVGSTIELSLAGSRLAAVLDRPNDPPLVGPAEDRVPRDESYTKDFRPFDLGTIELAAGRGELSLRALKIPGR
ncbi:MAG: hypothetical protein RL091_802, partial [Verrucomicrobiota bacterium]